MPTQLQVTRITTAGRISLGRAIKAMNAKEGDIIQIVKDDNGTIRIAKVEA